MTTVKKSIKELATLLAKLDEPKVIENMLQNLLTPNEMKAISQRLEIFKLLQKGVTQRKVAARLGVAIATVSRGARELKYGKKWWCNASKQQMRC